METLFFIENALFKIQPIILAIENSHDVRSNRAGDRPDARAQFLEHEYDHRNGWLGSAWPKGRR